MQSQDYRNTLIVMAGLAAATASGFVREAALAHQLGVGRAADVYLVAFALPEFVFVALPIVLSPAFIPLFVRRRQNSECSAWQLGRDTAITLLAGLIAFTVVAGLSAPVYMAWLGAGLDRPARAEAVQAMRLMLPAISLMGLSTLAGALLQVYQRFARPALATAVYNFTFIVVLLAPPLAPQPISRAAWGVTMGAVAALALQLPLLKRLRPSPGPGVAPTSARNLLDNAGKLLKLAAPLAAGYSIHHAILLIDRAMATTLGVGNAAALNYAYRLALVTAQLSGLAISTTLFPQLAQHITCSDLNGARTSLADALRFAWLIGLPATCGLIILRRPLVGLLFERGAFDPAATAAVSAPLVWYALAVLADTVCLVLWRAIYAQGDMKSVVVVNSLQSGVRWVANIALSARFGYNGLALSAWLGLSLQALVLAWLVRRQLGSYLTAAWWREVAGITLAAALASLVMAGLAVYLSAAPALQTLALSGAAGGAVYLVAWRIVRASKSARML